MYNLTRDYLFLILVINKFSEISCEFLYFMLQRKRSSESLQPVSPITLPHCRLLGTFTCTWGHPPQWMNIWLDHYLPIFSFAYFYNLIITIFFIMCSIVEGIHVIYRMLEWRFVFPSGRKTCDNTVSTQWLFAEHINTADGKHNSSTCTWYRSELCWVW